MRARTAAQAAPTATSKPSYKVPPSSCTESTPDLLNILLMAEQLSATFYYTALTTRAVVSHPYLAGSSGDPNNVASNGSPVNVSNLQAALDQEQKHAALLAKLGAVSSHTHFYFPARAFAALGYTSAPNTCLWVLDHIETFTISAYLAAVRRFGEVKRPDLAQLAARLAGSESQHRVLGRVISGEVPANNVALEVTSLTCASSLLGVLGPYLTGKGFAGGAGKPIAIPTAAQTAPVIGAHRSH